MVPYKVHIKVIVDKLKPIMPMLIIENQMSFVKGRYIMDSIIIAQEAIHSMRVRKGRLRWMKIKIDMEKAYDQLRWNFIKDTMEDAKLPNNLVRISMQCVSFPTMQVLWNGGFTEEFIPPKGVRQGDPISSYLFILTMERLGHLI